MYELQVLKDKAEVELMKQLDLENMVEMISIGDLCRADDILEAALKLTKAKMGWLRQQVYSSCVHHFWQAKDTAFWAIKDFFEL